MHDEAMEEVHQQEELRRRCRRGLGWVAKEKEIYKHAVNKQKDAMQNVKSMQQTLATTMSQHQTLQRNSRTKTDVQWAKFSELRGGRHRMRL